MFTFFGPSSQLCSRRLIEIAMRILRNIVRTSKAGDIIPTISSIQLIIICLMPECLWCEPQHDLTVLVCDYSCFACKSNIVSDLTEIVCWIFNELFLIDSGITGICDKDTLVAMSLPMSCSLLGITRGLQFFASRPFLKIHREHGLRITSRKGQ